MPLRKETNSRSNTKGDMKKEIAEYNNKPKQKLSITKAEIEKSGVELTPKQYELYRNIRDNIFTTIQGPAGTSKTFTACYTALCLLADKKIEKIIITKPIQESGENLGFLPGDIEEKTSPFMRSYMSNFGKIIGKQTSDFLKDSGFICVEPLAYMRGVTYDDSIILLDEAQNATMEQLILWLTRLGRNSKAVLMGDISQYDIKKQESKFLDFIKMTEGVNNSINFKFTSNDIIRNEFLIEIVDRYEKYKKSEILNKNK